MTAGPSKRKWAFGSKSFFASRAASKDVVVHDASSEASKVFGLSDLRECGLGSISRVGSKRNAATYLQSAHNVVSISQLKDECLDYGISGCDQVSTSPTMEDHKDPTSPSILTTGESGTRHAVPWNGDTLSMVQSQPQLTDISHACNRPESLTQGHSGPRRSHDLAFRVFCDLQRPTIAHRQTSLGSNNKDDSAVRSSLYFATQEGSDEPHKAGCATTTERSGGTAVLKVPTNSLHGSYDETSEHCNQTRDGFTICETPKGSQWAVMDLPARHLNQYASLHAPTIRTVEAAANAKIFFETYYDSLLAGSTTPRSLRRRALEKRLATNVFSEEQVRIKKIQWAKGESEHLRHIRLQRSKMKSGVRCPGVDGAGFEPIRVLGKGSFGIVRLVRERPHETKPCAWWDSCSSTQLGCKHAIPTSEVFAMKVIRKSDMLRNCQEAHLRAERDFLVSSERSRWIIPLQASFQDDINLYLVMDYMIGGDFLGLLFRKNVLKERHARWYVAEMLLCVEETHRRGWIHRDVKPDNFLISASGHLKISDFGLAFDGHWSHDQRFFRNHRRTLLEKLGIQVQGDLEDQKKEYIQRVAPTTVANTRGKQAEDATDATHAACPSSDEPILEWRNRQGHRRMAASVVGTSQYMAPEVIQGFHYDGRCDWWSIGIILYECLYGFTPFVCETRDETKLRIVDHHRSLRFPRETSCRVSVDAIDLVRQLLRDKERRLCSRRYRGNDLQRRRRKTAHIFNACSRECLCGGQSRFVYPDDAADIKSHDFFSSIAWERHHLTRPPFVPDCKDKEDTKYFDEEDTVSDLGNYSSHQVEDGMPEHACNTPFQDHKNLAIAPDLDGLLDAKTNQTHTVVEALNAKQHVRAPKRPRDKILRDENIARQALDVRKKGVFVGYTYRRPKEVLMSEDGA